MTTNDTGRFQREARFKWVPIAKMRLNPLAQRDLNPSRVDRIAADFDPEQIGIPTVSERDGHFYLIDGQHRVAALKQIGWEDQQIQCCAYLGLTSDDEAEMFLKLNDVLTVDGFTKFRVGVQAGRDVECEIERLVKAEGLVVSRDGVPGGIRAVATLRRVHSRGGPKTLSRTLAIARDAYGDAGLDGVVLDGIGLLCQRYNGDLNDAEAIKKLSGAHGGVNGLINKAEVLRKQTGSAKGHCVAAAAVDIINTGRGGVRLPSWWRAEA